MHAYVYVILCKCICSLSLSLSIYKEYTTISLTMFRMGLCLFQSEQVSSFPTLHRQKFTGAYDVVWFHPLCGCWMIMMISMPHHPDRLPAPKAIQRPQGYRRLEATCDLKMLAANTHGAIKRNWLLISTPLKNMSQLG